MYRHMKKHKRAIEKFFAAIDRADRKLQPDTISETDEQLLYIVRSCRNKLAEVYNKIGDPEWDMPDMELR